MATFGQVLAALAVGVATFLGLAVRMHVDEVSELLALLGGRIRR